MHSGLIHAIITITSRDLREAITICEMARQTPVDVPGNIDNHAATWWMQPRGEAQQQSAWTAHVSADTAPHAASKTWHGQPRTLQTSVTVAPEHENVTQYY